MKKKNQIFLSENFRFLVVKFSIYLNRLVFIMSFQIKYSENRGMQWYTFLDSGGFKGNQHDFGDFLY